MASSCFAGPGPRLAAVAAAAGRRALRFGARRQPQRLVAGLPDKEVAHCDTDGGGWVARRSSTFGVAAGKTGRGRGSWSWQSECAGNGDEKGSCSTRTGGDKGHAQCLHARTRLVEYSPPGFGTVESAFALVTSNRTAETVELQSPRLTSAPALHSAAIRPTARVAGASARDPPERSLAQPGLGACARYSLVIA
jgi:hypothetical protein